ncbi:hypothetical protein BpHYR1_053674 [Brachionus plicatilis]|uniref:Uncharacterized protein n=1 Tax=Brachionus plicatilis TaxID=10195 RepID=A0A3M7P8C0_BRAPC|nr:hypothetical protein BpHYR1_053674 [Brachionus plicatilis]
MSCGCGTSAPIAPNSFPEISSPISFPQFSAPISSCGSQISFPEPISLPQISAPISFPQFSAPISSCGSQISFLEPISLPQIIFKKVLIKLLLLISFGSTIKCRNSEIKALIAKIVLRCFIRILLKTVISQN